MLKFFIETKISASGSADILVLPYLNGKILAHPLIEAVRAKLQGFHEKLLNKLSFKGEAGEMQLLATHGKIPYDYILFLGLGNEKKLSIEDLRKAAAAQARLAEQKKAVRLDSALSLVAQEKFSTQERAQALGEGTLLSLYRFEKYKGKAPEKSSLTQVHWILAQEKQKTDFQKGLRVAEKISATVMFARDWINIPSQDKPPMALARAAKKLAGIQTKVFDHKKIAEIGMGALYGVGMGSSHPPAFVEMHYKPTGKVKKTIAIVGKGITFDSGGLSLKPAKSMETMKDDMSGAAAVLAVMRVLPELKYPVEVFGYMTCAENMPDGAALRPGDVVKAYNGKTIEVLNTDAEGRLALADALSYLTKHRKIDYIIDLATLTGAALVALGDQYTAALGNDDGLLDLLKSAGDHCGEKIWPLPLEESYAEEMKSDIADIKNIGGPFGGTINGALFLKNFVDEKSKWVHLDIAGPAWAYKLWPYSLRGGTGIMVRTLLRLFSQL